MADYNIVKQDFASTQVGSYLQEKLYPDDTTKVFAFEIRQDNLKDIKREIANNPAFDDNQLEEAVVKVDGGGVYGDSYYLCVASKLPDGFGKGDRVPIGRDWGTVEAVYKDHIRRGLDHIAHAWDVVENIGSKDKQNRVPTIDDAIRPKDTGYNALAQRSVDPLRVRPRNDLGYDPLAELLRRNSAGAEEIVGKNYTFEMEKGAAIEGTVTEVVREHIPRRGRTMDLGVRVETEYGPRLVLSFDGITETRGVDDWCEAIGEIRPKK